MKSPVFLEENYERVFAEDGFIHIKGFLNGEELQALRDAFSSVYNYSGEAQGMWNSLFNISPESSSQVSQRILQILDDKLRSHFKDYKAPVASFMVKNPNRNGITDLHRDYSTQDEENFQYRNIWIPLVDTVPENGALYALKHSHSFFNYPLPMFCQWPYKLYQQTLFGYCDVIDAKAGDLVVYADRALHGSFINKTGVPRPVVHFGLLHPEAELCYYYLDEQTNQVSVYDVPYSFFFENKFGNQDGRFNLRRRFNYEPPVYSEAEIFEGLRINEQSHIKG